jgi:hypothetical protein
MTNERVTDFASELVQMAMAMKRLPEVEALNINLRDQLDERVATVQRLELKLLDRAGEITALHATIRTLEAARDDAELRFLEASDSVAAFTRLVKSFSVDAGVLVKALEPEPVAPPFTPEPMVPLASEIAASSPQLRAEAELTGLTDSDAESGEVVHDESGFSAGFSVGESSARSTGSGRSSDVAGQSAEPAAAVNGSVGEGADAPIPFATSSPGGPSETAGEGASAPASSPQEENWTTKLGPNPSKPSDPPSGEYWPNAFNRASHQS